MKTNRIVIVSLVATAALGLTSAFAATAASGDNSPARSIVGVAVRHFLNFRSETPLSAEQKAKVRAVLQSHRDEIKAQLAKGRDARRAMAGAVENQGASSPATIGAAAKVGEAARDRALLVARISSEVKPLLTPEQIARITAARNELQSLVDEKIANLPL